MPTFGKTTNAAGNYGPITNNIIGTAYIISENGIADSITVEFAGDGTTNVAKCLIFRADDGAFIDETEELSITPPAWNTRTTFNFITKPTLSVNTAYILAFWTPATGWTLGTSWSATSKLVGQVLPYGIAPFVLEPQILGDSEASIYCTYTAVTTPPQSLLFHSCTSLANSEFQNKPAGWVNNGVAPSPEAVIVVDGDLLPDGTIVKSFKSGKCTRLMTGFTSPGVRQCCNFYSGWMNGAVNWDFNGNELLKIRVFTNKANLMFHLYVMGNGWTQIAEIVLAPGTTPINTWTEISLDLRSFGASPTLLSQGQAVCLHVEEIGNDQNTTYVLTEYWTVEPATGIPPVGCDISPLVTTVEKNQLVAFTARVWGGTTPYTVQWMLNNMVVKTDTMNTTGSVNYNFSSDIAGTYQLFVRVTDSGSPQQTKDSAIAIIVVKKPVLPRQPCRPLHVEGNKIKDDLGNIIHVHGVNWHGFEDHPYGHCIDQNGAIHWRTFDVAIIRQMLDGLITWGVNCIRCHSSLSAWKGNYGNIQTNFQTLLTEANQRGIYVILDFFDIGYYNMGGTQDPVPWLPVNADTPISDVTGFSGVTWAKETDIIPDIASFATFWGTVANLLKNYPNILFEFWNEPVGVVTADWFNATQQCINAVRNAGANQLILTQWGYGVAYYPGQPLAYSIKPWVDTYASKLIDPSGNIVISTHCYRTYDGFGRWSDGHRGYMVAELTEAFTDEFLQVAQTYPLLIGEISAVSGDVNDLIAIQNALAILNKNGVHYTLFWFFTGLQWDLLSGQPNYQPTDAGVALIQAIQDIQVPPPPPNKGRLEVHAFFDATEIVMRVQIEGIGSYDTPFTLDLDPQQYTLKAIYQNQTKTEIVNLSSDQILRVDFRFTSPTPLTSSLLIAAVPVVIIGGYFLLKGKR